MEHNANSLDYRLDLCLLIVNENKGKENKKGAPKWSTLYCME